MNSKKAFSSHFPDGLIDAMGLVSITRFNDLNNYGAVTYQAAILGGGLSVAVSGQVKFMRVGVSPEILHANPEFAKWLTGWTKSELMPEVCDANRVYQVPLGSTELLFGFISSLNAPESLPEPFVYGFDVMVARVIEVSKLRLTASQSGDWSLHRDLGPVGLVVFADSSLPMLMFKEGKLWVAARANGAPVDLHRWAMSEPWGYSKLHRGGLARNWSNSDGRAVTKVREVKPDEMAGVMKMIGSMKKEISVEFESPTPITNVVIH